MQVRVSVQVCLLGKCGIQWKVTFYISQLRYLLDTVNNSDQLYKTLDNSYIFSHPKSILLLLVLTVSEIPIIDINIADNGQ